MTDFVPILAVEGLWMPDSAGGFAGGGIMQSVDWLYNFMIVVFAFFVLLIGSLMVWFSYRYRQRDKRKVAHGAHHSTLLELGWTIPPLLIVLFIFAAGFSGFLNMTNPPLDAYPIRVEAKQWGWNFYYPNGAISSQELRKDENGEQLIDARGLPAFDYMIYVPSDRPIQMTLESLDVIHDLYLPAFRIKKDVVPGRFNTLWFEPDGEGVSDGNPQSYDMYCAEYCGQGHSQMSGKIVVMSPNDFKAKLEELNVWNRNDLPPVALGEQLHKSQCATCHSVQEGVRIQGPSWSNLWGSKHQLINGQTATVDHAYTVEAIRYPAAEKQVGYAAGNMPAFGEQSLPPGDVEAIVEFMKSISDKTGEKPLEKWPEGYNGATYLADFAGAEGGETSTTGTDQPAIPSPQDEPLEGNTQRINPETGVVQ